MKPTYLLTAALLVIGASAVPITYGFGSCQAACVSVTVRRETRQRNSFFVTLTGVAVLLVE
jgi:hypothetical protein